MKEFKDTIKNNSKQTILVAIGIIFIVIALLFEQDTLGNVTNNTTNNITNTISYSIDDIPEYDGELYTEINNNIPEFSDEDMLLEEDYYSELDNSGRVRDSND